MSDKYIIIFAILFFAVEYAVTNSMINKRCEILIRKTYPDAICHAASNPESCSSSCKKQAEMKCGSGRPNMIQKLQCRKQRKTTGLFSCCCRVDCHGQVKTEALPTFTEESCSSINVKDLWNDVWNGHNEARLNRKQEKPFDYQSSYELQRSNLKRIVSCCELTKDGCKDIQGDCDHDMECQPGFYCGHGNCLKKSGKEKKIARTMSEWLMHDLISHDCCVPIEEIRDDEKIPQDGKEMKYNKMLYQSKAFGNQQLSNAIGMILLHGLEKNDEKLIHESRSKPLINPGVVKDFPNLSNASDNQDQTSNKKERKGAQTSKGTLDIETAPENKENFIDKDTTIRVEGSGEPLSSPHEMKQTMTKVADDI